jgi:hypothetical protein
MEKPNPESIALGDEMFYLRGKIITGYAQVEFFLADLSVKLNVKFPFKIKDRIKAAKEIADRPGYSEYREELHEICDQLARYDNIRHFMAHGLVMIKSMAGQHSVEMRRYDRKDNVKFVRYDLFTDLNKLRNASNQVSGYKFVPWRARNKPLQPLRARMPGVPVDLW